MGGLDLELIEQIRELYRQQPDEAGRAIEMLLENRYAGLSAAEKIDRGKAIAAAFQPPQQAADGSSELRHFLSLLLGQPVGEGELDDAALQSRACRVIGTVFERLNQLLNAIQLSSGPGGNQVEETIRHVLKEQMVQDLPAGSLEDYVDRIRDAFFGSIEAAQQGHRTIVEKILRECDPQTFMAGSGGGLKIGPLKKAEAFDGYVRMYDQLKKWHESGRGSDEFTRAFEKYFGKIVTNQQGFSR